MLKKLPEDYFARLEAAGQNYGLAKANETKTEKMLDIIFAEEFLLAKNNEQYKSMSVELLKAVARTSPRYLVAVGAAANAQAQLVVAKTQLDILNKIFDEWRTLSANTRHQL